jgi:hypothetical protein
MGRITAIKLLLTLLISVGGLASARAQDNAFEPAPKKSPAGKTETKPAKKEVQQDPGPSSYRPAVQAILQLNPTAPAELARAAKALSDLNEPKLSKTYIKKIADLNLDAEKLADLGEQSGPSLFVSLGANKDLQPEAGDLSKAVLTALNERVQNPERIAQLIQQLRDPSSDVRAKALVGLLTAHEAAAGPLIEVLADPSRAAEFTEVRAALVRLDEEAVGPLLGALEGGEPALQAQVLGVLSGINSRKTAIFMLRPCLADNGDPEVREAAAAALKRLIGRLPERADALWELIDKAESYLNQRTPIQTQSPDAVTLWSWDKQTKQCVSRICTTEDASRSLAARLARDAFQLAPKEPRVQSLYLTAAFENAAYANGLDKTLFQGPGQIAKQFAGFDAKAIEAALAYALAHKRAGAGTIAAQLLERFGNAEELLYRGAEPGPLAAAARNSDRRVRLAADQAIVRLKPSRPYPGSSYVLQSLAFFVTTRGTPRVLIGGMNTEDAREIAGYYISRGMQVDTAFSGRETFRLASSSPDYALALIDAGVDRPTIDPLVQQIRQDWRTADLRVGVVARSAYFDQAERLERENPLTLSCPRSRSEETSKQQYDRLTALDHDEYVSPESRRRQAAVALDLLDELCGTQRNIYDLSSIREALLTASANSDLNAKAKQVLEKISKR